MVKNLIVVGMALAILALAAEVVLLRNDNQQCISHIKALEATSVTTSQLENVVGAIKRTIEGTEANCKLSAAEDLIQHAQDYASIYQYELISNDVAWLQDRVSQDEKDALNREAK